MANQGYPYPWAGNVGYSNEREHDLRHQISSISAVSSNDGHQSGPRDSVVSLPSPPSDGPSRAQSAEQLYIGGHRNSSLSSSGLVSPRDTRNNSYSSMNIPETLRAGTPTQSPSIRLQNPFRSPPQAYQPVYDPSESSQVHRTSSSKRYTSKRRKSSLLDPRSIPEGEEINMKLLGSAMPMGNRVRQNTAYTSLREDDTDDVPLFDVSSLEGPPQTEEQLREVNKREAAGILTGGLGMGLKPETVMTSTDLCAKAPQILASAPASPLARRMTMLRNPSSRSHSIRNGLRSPGLGKSQTIDDIRELGQREANKSGKVVEVLLEEDEPTVDISSFAGGSTPNVDYESASKVPRQNTIAPQVEVFYPRLNWKPFSMRWPYITALVTISIILAAAQEYLLHRGALYTFTSAARLSTWDYFSFKYLPTLIAVTFGVLWQITDFEVKRLEAFYQLSKKDGALAAESINVDYITFFNFLRPVRALQYKHYAVAVSSLATLMAVSLVPTLQVASLELRPDRTARELDPGGEKNIHISPIWSRALSSVLLLIAVMGCVLIWQLERRPSGLVADVKGIAGIAAMANRSHILMDFKDMDTAKPEEIHERLKSHRYSLRNSSLAPEDKVPLTQAEKDKYDQKARPENPHPLMLRLVAGVPFIGSMFLFMIIVPIVLFIPSANIISDKAPWLLTGMAVCIKLAWGTLETDVRMIEPFYILSKRYAPPNVLTLDYTAMAFGWMPIRAFANQHFLVGLVGLGSVLAEVLTVCATSFANVSGHDFMKSQPPPPPTGTVSDQHSTVNSGEETFLSFWLSFSLALGIITFLCLVATLVYLRRRHPFLPRQPNTIASILAFIHQSRMLYDFVGTEKMNNDEMVARLGGLGKRYGLGWFTGRDGEVHCGVDEEDLIQSYKHGDDARKASQPWTTNWENY